MSKDNYNMDISSYLESEILNRLREKVDKINSNNIGVHASIFNGSIAIQFDEEISDKDEEQNRVKILINGGAILKKKAEGKTTFTPDDYYLINGFGEKL
jgi:hypothetical protein